MQTGAQVLFQALESEGVEVVFGVPGGAIMPVYDALLDSPIRHVLMRHEQGAGHAAEGYAHVTGRPGVCFATSGPGACNLVTALSDAMMDSIPLVAITGQGRSATPRSGSASSPPTTSGWPRPTAASACGRPAPARSTASSRRRSRTLAERS